MSRKRPTQPKGGKGPKKRKEMTEKQKERRRMDEKRVSEVGIFGAMKNKKKKK